MPAVGDAMGTTSAAAALARFGAAHRTAVRAEWAAAEAAGLPLIVVDDGSLLLGAAPTLESQTFNRALGLTERPDLLATALAFFADHGVEGTVVLDPSDAPPGIAPMVSLEVHLGAPDDTMASAVDGLDIHLIDASDGPAVATWMRILIEANTPPPDIAALWRRMAPFMVGTPGWSHLAGSVSGEMVAAGSLFETDGVGWQSWASVVPVARGRGIQRALIGARSRLAAEHGCDLVAAWALTGAHSSANLERAGLARIGRRVVFRSSDLG
jgi:GNAT superfamily N-acetyltransferase